jgi:hypothetical protein
VVAELVEESTHYPKFEGFNPLELVKIAEKKKKAYIAYLQL